MKKYFVAALLLPGFAVQAQKGAPKKAATPVKKTTAANPMKNLQDSVSYAIGLQVANFYSQQGVKNLNGNLVARAIADVYSKKQPLLNEDQAQNAVMRLLNPDLFTHIEKGEKFLAANKKKAGVTTTASGLQYEVIRAGNGPKPGPTDTVEVNYMGTLLDGTEFDNSYKRGQPISFPLDRVISGWTEALQLMPVGSKYKLYIPQQLGYGMNGSGHIPGGSLLIFEVELLSIKGK